MSDRSRFDIPSTVLDRKKQKRLYPLDKNVSDFATKIGENSNIRNFFLLKPKVMRIQLLFFAVYKLVQKARAYRTTLPLRIMGFTLFVSKYSFSSLT